MMTIDQLVKEFDCDAAFCEGDGDFPDLVRVSPYDTKTKQWVMGMTLITSWDEVLKAKCGKVCRKEDKLANEKLKSSTKGQKPERK